jgi:uncharacterized protein
VRTDAAELDFEDPDTLEQMTTEYDGEGGVPINSLARRLAFTLRFNDYNLMLTGLLNDESRILIHRNVRDRVQEVAPFLRLDSDPYPVVSDDGRVRWIVDAYTTSEWWPYSEREVLDTGDEQHGVNYVRNSVKAVVDAYDGDITLYRVEDDDPVLDAWEQAFPDALTPVEEAGTSPPTSATRRTCSVCRPTSTPATTSPTRTRSTTAPTRGRSRPTRPSPPTRAVRS